LIAYLKGIVRDKKPDQVIVEVRGVGYLVQIPLSTFYKLPAVGEEQEFHVYTHVREDQISLFGFADQQELDIFRALLSVRGFGPKMALTTLSGMDADSLIQCLVNSDVIGLSGIPGIGKKTAERLIYELREKLHKYVETKTAAATAGDVTEGMSIYMDDLISALVNLGYPKQQAEKAVRLGLQEAPDDSFESLLKRSLKIIMAR